MFEPVIVIADFPFPDITHTVVCILELKYALVSHKKQREKKTYHQGLKRCVLHRLGPLLWSCFPFPIIMRSS